MASTSLHLSAAVGSSAAAVAPAGTDPVAGDREQGVLALPNHVPSSLNFSLKFAAVSSTTLPAWFVQPAHAFDGGSGGGGWGDSGGWGGGGGGRAGGEAGAFASLSSNPQSRPKKQVSITLVSFAVTKVLYEKLTKQFSQQWQQQTGQPVRFRLSFGGSGSQARAVIDGLPADIIALALPLDVLKIEEAGLIAPDWRTRVPNNAVNAESVVCIMTLPGNPKHVSGWDDLPREDLTVLTANPKTAGVARWNFVALWGSVILNNGSDKEAKDYVENVFARVPVQPRDAREASDVFFHQHLTDALITYENEAIVANQVATKEGKLTLPYVVPEPNVVIENVVAVVDKNVDKNGNREVCEAFVQFLFTPAAQHVVAECGFRPVLPEILEEYRWKYPVVKKLWRVEEHLGGWNAVHEKFFNRNGVLDQIENDVRNYRIRPLPA